MIGWAQHEIMNYRVMMSTAIAKPINEWFCGDINLIKGSVEYASNVLLFYVGAVLYNARASYPRRAVYRTPAHSPALVEKSMSKNV